MASSSDSTVNATSLRPPTGSASAQASSIKKTLNSTNSSTVSARSSATRPPSQRALATLKNKDASIPDRKQALASLLTQRHKGLAPTLKSLLDEPALRIDAIRAFTSAPTPDAAKLLLDRYPKFQPAAQKAIIETLATRKVYARSAPSRLEGKANLPRGSSRLRHALAFPPSRARLRQGIQPQKTTLRQGSRNREIQSTGHLVCSRQSQRFLRSKNLPGPLLGLPCHVWRRRQHWPRTHRLQPRRPKLPPPQHSLPQRRHRRQLQDGHHRPPKTAAPSPGTSPRKTDKKSSSTWSAKKPPSPRMTSNPAPSPTFQ